MDALWKCMFIIIEIIVDRMKSGHVSKNMFMSIRHMKNNPDSHYFSFFALSNLHKPVYIFTRQGQLTSSEHAKCFPISVFPLCATYCYFDAAKFSIKLFSLIYLLFLLSDNGGKYKIVTEMWPITTSLHNQLSLPRC